MITRTLPFIAVAMLCAATLGCGPTAESADDPPSVLVKTTPIRAQVVRETLAVFGTIAPDPVSLATITAPRAVVIAQLSVRLGQRVATGDPIATFESAPGAALAFQQSASGLAFAKVDLDRVRRRYALRLATTDQLAAAQRALADANAAAVEQNKLHGAQARETIRASFDGIVTAVSVAPGDKVAADGPIAVVARGGGLIVPLGLEPADAARVVKGQSVVIVPVFASPVGAKATIASVHGMVNPTTRLVDAVASIDPEASAKLIIGASVRASIEIASREALVVPRDAVLTDTEGSYLFVVVGGKAHLVRVNAGIEQGDAAEISGAGIKAGDAVVSLGNYELADGTPVRMSAK